MRKHNDGGDRVRDLVDLQLIASNGTVDLCATRAVCERLFAYRRKQEWPPAVVKQPGWDELYAEQASGSPSSRKSTARSNGQTP